ncbi:hypothetical protein QQZ08_001572 [Neonectria magnoliae]|uniref:Dienelactone hydrolase domain-containing protein n=1 Tax=Neonectria magnoliae TaxID=2732573 RepID=A0ABR1IE91_9HYPO
MTSNPPAQCCTTGFLHEGNPKGTLITIDNGIQAYLASPPASKAHAGIGILYVLDVIGIWQNSKLMADVQSGLKYLRDTGVKCIGGVGYCFGGEYVVHHYKTASSSGFVAHPSFVEPEELAVITGLLSIAAAETGSIFPIEKRRELERIFIETKQEYQINLFSGVEHGFSVRGDPNVKVQRFAKEQAFHRAVSWLDSHLVDKREYGLKVYGILGLEYLCLNTWK